MPGHGAVGGPYLIEQTAAYLRWILRVARVAIKHRLAAKQSLGFDARSEYPWHSWPCGERDLVNVMAELAGEAVDLVLAINAVVRTTGGRLPRRRDHERGWGLLSVIKVILDGPMTTEKPSEELPYCFIALVQQHC